MLIRTIVIAIAMAFAASAAQAQRAPEWRFCDSKNLGTPDERIRNCTTLIQSPRETQPNRVVAYRNRGLAWRQKGDVDRAIADYTDAVRLDPKHADSYISRGSALHAKADYDRAISDYSEAIRINPKGAIGYFNRANSWRAKGDLNRAIADYTDAIRLHPKDADSYIHRGLIWRAKGELDNAIADYTEAIRINPKSAAAYSNRAFARNAKGDVDRALADYTEAIRLDPKSAVAYINRGLIWRAKGELDSAIADYTEAIRISPNSASAYNNRGYAKSLKGDLDGAINDYAEALRIDPKHANALANRERAHALRSANPSGAAAPPPPAQPPSPAASPPKSQTTVAALPPAAAGSKFGRRVALVIGNAAYQSAPKLTNPQRDAAAMADAFRRVGFAEVMLHSDLSKHAMERALIAFTDIARGADWAVVYFAGHGLELNGQNFLIPIDAQLKHDTNVGLEAISLNQVLNAASTAKLMRFVILDACRDNPFLAQMSRSLATRSLGRGLSPVEPPDGGTLVAFAARHGEVALDGSGRNSPFVQALLQHLDEPGLDVRLMLAKVRDSVMAATKRAQEPYTYGSLPGVTLTFRPTP